MYTPDNWVVVKIGGSDPHYRVLAGWSGGYATGDSWRANSGIVKVEKTEDGYYNFYGSSGSVYHCHEESYTLRKNNSYVWDAWKEQLGDKVQLMSEDTDWLNMDWIIK